MYEHITEMENKMVQLEGLVRELEAVLDRADAAEEDYAALVSYYYSEQRSQDLADDENGRIPQDLHRGVLSEDEIFDLMGDHRELGLRMIQMGLNMVRNT